MKYKVIDVFTGADITHVYSWLLTPTGELGYIKDGYFVVYRTAKAITVVEDWNED